MYRRQWDHDDTKRERQICLGGEEDIDSENWTTELDGEECLLRVVYIIDSNLFRLYHMVLLSTLEYHSPMVMLS
jgi:hypothetical protein